MHKKQTQGNAETAHWLGVPIALTNDPGLVPSTQIQLITVYNFSSKGHGALLWPLKAPGRHPHGTQIHMQVKYSHT